MRQMKTLVASMLLILLCLNLKAVVVTRTVKPIVGTNLSFKVELNFSDLGSNGGFAKLSEMIPEGGTIKEIDFQGGEYSYSDGEIKLIWKNKGSNDFTVVYHVSFASKPAVTSIIGRYYYVEGEIVKTYEISESELFFSDQELVNINRKINAISGSENTFKVELKLTNLSSLGGFAKLTEFIPKGGIVKEIDFQGGEYSFSNGEMKLIWMSKNKHDFTVVYHVSFDQKPSVSFIDGEFKYLSGEEMKLVSIGRSNLPYRNEVASNVQEVQKTTDNVKAKNPVKKTLSNGTVYKVQIAAAVTDDFKFNEAVRSLGEIEIDKIGNMYKYTSGSFTSKQDALQHRLKLIDAGINGPFMVRYVNGVRQ